MILGDARGVPRVGCGCKLKEDDGCPTARCESGMGVSIGNALEVICVVDEASGACCRLSGTAADIAGWDMICRRRSTTSELCFSADTLLCI